MTKYYNFSLYCPQCQSYQRMAYREGIRHSAGAMECALCSTPLRSNKAARSVLLLAALLMTFYIGGFIYTSNDTVPGWAIYPLMAFVIYTIAMLPFSFKAEVDPRTFDDRKDGQLVFTGLLIVIAGAVFWGLVSSL